MWLLSLFLDWNNLLPSLSTKLQSIHFSRLRNYSPEPLMIKLCDCCCSHLTLLSNFSSLYEISCAYVLFTRLDCEHFEGRANVIILSCLVCLTHGFFFHIRNSQYFFCQPIKDLHCSWMLISKYTFIYNIRESILISVNLKI